MSYTAGEQICVNEARDKIVDCNGPEARYTLALPGAEISDEDAKKYGLGSSKSKAVGAAPDEAESEDAAEEKAQAAPPQNKAKNGAQNK